MIGSCWRIVWLVGILQCMFVDIRDSNLSACDSIVEKGDELEEDIIYWKETIDDRSLIFPISRRTNI